MTTPELELPAAFDFRVVRGLIAILEADGLCEYREPPASFPADYTGTAALLQKRPASPDRVLSFTPYAVTQDAAQAMDRLGVQVWMRYAGTNPRAVQNLAGAVRDALHGLSYVTLSTGVTMSQCLRSSGSSLGQESSSTRWTWVENFYADVHHPDANRD